MALEQPVYNSLNIGLVTKLIVTTQVLQIDDRRMPILHIVAICKFGSVKFAKIVRNPSK
jgi:hypothetical protein